MTWSKPGPGRTQLMTDDEIRAIIRAMDSDGIWPTYYRAHEERNCFCDIHRFARLRNAMKEAGELKTSGGTRKRDRKAEAIKRRAGHFTHKHMLHDRRVPKPREVKAPKEAPQPRWTKGWHTFALDVRRRLGLIQIVPALESLVQAVETYDAAWADLAGGIGPQQIVNAGKTEDAFEEG